MSLILSPDHMILPFRSSFCSCASWSAVFLLRFCPPLPDFSSSTYSSSEYFFSGIFSAKVAVLSTEVAYVFDCFWNFISYFSARRSLITPPSTAGVVSKSVGITFPTSFSGVASSLFDSVEKNRLDCLWPVGVVNYVESTWKGIYRCGE